MWTSLRDVPSKHVLLVGIIAFIATACSGASEPARETPSPEPVNSFYLEARFEIADDEADHPFPPDGPAIYNFKWWFESPDRFRREVETVGPPHLSRSSLNVSADDRWISFDANLNRFLSTPAPESTDSPPPSSAMIGPLSSASIEDWIALNRERLPHFDARLLRTDEMLGREVKVYEFSDVGALLDEEGMLAASSTGRIWIHESTGFVLKYEGADSYRAIAEVTRLELNRPIDPNRFTFSAPDDAIEVRGDGGHPSIIGKTGVGEDADPPPGLLAIRWLPPAFHEASSERISTESGMDIVSRYENSWLLTDGRALRVRQLVRTAGLPTEFITGETTISSSTQHYGYYVSRSEEDDWIRLAWQDVGVTVTVEGIGIELAELTRVADGVLRPWVTPPEG